MGRFEHVIAALDSTPFTIGEMNQLDATALERLRGVRIFLTHFDEYLEDGSEASMPPTDSQDVPPPAEGVAAKATSPKPVKAKSKTGRRACDPNQRVECTLCGRPCASTGYLRRHMEIKHPGDVGGEDATIEASREIVSHTEPVIDDSSVEDDGVDFISVAPAQVTEGYAERMRRKIF